MAFFISSTVIISSLPLYLHIACLIFCLIEFNSSISDGTQLYSVLYLLDNCYAIPSGSVVPSMWSGSLCNCHSSSYFLSKNLYGFYYLLNTQPFLIYSSQTLFLMALIALLYICLVRLIIWATTPSLGLPHEIHILFQKRALSFNGWTTNSFQYGIWVFLLFKFGKHSSLVLMHAWMRSWHYSLSYCLWLSS